MTDEEKKTEGAPAAEAAAPPCAGEVVRISRRSIVVGYAPDECPVLAVGAEASFAVRLAGEEEACEMSGRVLYWGLKDGREVYGFEVDEELLAELKRTQQQRRALRVIPDETMYVTAKAGETAVQGEIQDVSETGISVLFEPEVEAALAAALGGGDEAWALTIRFALEGNDDALELASRVLYRVVAGDRIKHGIAFALDEEGEPRRIADHLLRYQSEVIRRVQGGG